MQKDYSGQEQAMQNLVNSLKNEASQANAKNQPKLMQLMQKQNNNINNTEKLHIKSKKLNIKKTKRPMNNKSKIMIKLFKV